jgi:hypothetical protein
LYTKDKKKLIQYAIGNGKILFEMPRDVTTVGDSAFSTCACLESITIPKSVTTIEDFALDNCSKLRQVRYDGTVEMWKNVKLGKSALRKIATKEVLCVDGNAKV